MDDSNLYRKQKIESYRTEIEPFFSYISWFKDKMGKNQERMYEGNDGSSMSVVIPLYDSTLLSFVKSIQATGLMDHNYPYIYVNHGIKSTEDEFRLIQSATLKDISLILGIMSKYVLKGMTKGQVWSEGVANGVFYYSLVKIKEILEVWEAPLA